MVCREVRRPVPAVAGRELPASYADLVGREGGVVTSRASPGAPRSLGA